MQSRTSIIIAAAACAFVFGAPKMSRVRAQEAPSQNAFNTQFKADASDLDMRNAYLLGYLSTMIYPEYLRYTYTPPRSATSSSIKKIKRDDDAFALEYEKQMAYLFTSPSNKPLLNASTVTLNSTLAGSAAQRTLATDPPLTVQFIHKCSAEGYDPEALLLSTPSAIFVVFRGTDRVGCNISDFGHQWAEWISTNFKFATRPATVLSASVQGRVHRGMADSLLLKLPGETQTFADQVGTAVASKLTNAFGQKKKVWITGHSLGGAHAQLFAMFLRFNYGITAQGLYLYASPHPGDPAFAKQLDAVIGRSKIQRFEFGDDPIPTLPPQVFGYGRAGMRNYFKDYNSGNLKSEQIPAVDDLKILCVMGNLPGEQVPQAAQFVFPPYCPGSTCFHHPTLVLGAIRHQLASGTQASLPAAVPFPAVGDNCTSGDLNKAQNSDMVTGTIDAVETIIAGIAWQATNVLGNLIGTEVAEGRYRVRSYAFKNSSKSYLTSNGNGHEVSISTSGTYFNLVHKLIGGYQLYAGDGNLAADVKFDHGIPTGQENTDNAIMKTRDSIIGDEETWFLFAIPNTVRTYAVLNWNTRRVLDAVDDCLSNNRCGINERSASSNDATQVWILEPVD